MMKLPNDFGKIRGINMGGRGSGNWYRYSSKPTEENFWRLSIAWLRKQGIVKQGNHRQGSISFSNSSSKSSFRYEVNITENYSGYFRVYYTNTNTGQKYDYNIQLTITHPNYGGIRWWFNCPARGCGKRVAVLYLGGIFACRHCHNMAYSSQNENSAFRLSSKAQKIHQKLGGSGCLMDGKPDKPKGMHWKTYNRLVETMIDSDNASWIEAGLRFGILP